MQLHAHTPHRQLSAGHVRPQQPFGPSARLVQRQAQRACVARARVDEDAALEERLAALRRAKGATPDKEGSKAKKRIGEAPSSSSSSSGSGSKAQDKKYDFTNETVHWEGGPAAGDLAFNVALGATLVALPLSIGAAARAAFVRYRFTDKRVSVTTNAPWESKQTDCAYQEVKDVRTVSRSLGAWGDMVIELKNGDKLELRSLEKFKELRDYVLQRRDALGGGPPKQQGSAAIMDLDLDDEEAMKKGKGFA